MSLSGTLRSESRKGYSMKEKKDILRYIANRDAYSEVKGRRFWVEFADSKKTTRTWQSLKEVFIKRILTDLRNPYYELSLEDIKKFYAGSNTNGDAKTIEWLKNGKLNDVFTRSSGSHIPNTTSTTVSEQKDNPQNKVTPPDVGALDSDTDIELVSIRARASPTQEAAQDIESNIGLPGTSIEDNVEKNLANFPGEINNFLNIEDSHRLSLSPEIINEHEFSPNRYKEPFLLLGSEDSSDVVESHDIMDKCKQPKDNLFGFSTGKPTFISNNTKRKHDLRDSEEYKNEFKPTSSKAIAFSTPSKRKKFKGPPETETSSDCQSDDSSDCEGQYIPLRSVGDHRGKGKGQKMYCSLNGNLIQLYQSKHRKCSERQKIYTHFEDNCKYGKHVKKQKSRYINDEAKIPEKQSQELVFNHNEKTDATNQQILNYWKMKYISEKKRANEIFRLLSIQKSSLKPKLPIENPMIANSSNAPVELRRQEGNKSTVTKTSQLLNERPSVLKNSNLTASAVKSSTSAKDNQSEKGDLLMVKYAKNSNVEAATKSGLDNNVILIDTQKADILFDLLKKLTEKNIPTDNTQALDSKQNENALNSIQSNEDIQPVNNIESTYVQNEKSMELKNAGNHQLRTQNAKLSKTHTNKENVQNYSKLELSNKKLTKTQKDEIDEIFLSLEVEGSSSSTSKRNDSTEDNDVVKNIRDKENNIFEQILSRGDSHEDLNTNRDIFSSSEVKMLLNENSHKGNSLLDAKSLEYENNSKLLPRKSGRNSKISPKNVTTGAVRRSHRTQLSQDVTSTGSEGKKEVMEADVKNEQNDINTKYKKDSQGTPRSEDFIKSERRDLLTVKYAKNSNTEAVTKSGLDNNVILIDTQKADILFDLLKKLTEKNIPTDNTQALDSKQNENALNSIQSNEDIQPVDNIKSTHIQNEKSMELKNAGNHPLTTQNAKLSKTHTNKENVQNYDKLELPNKKLTNTQNDEIDEIFFSLDQEGSSSSTPKINDSTEDNDVIKNIRDKENKNFEQILSGGDSHENLNTNRDIFSSLEVKMLLNENSHKGNSLLDAKSLEYDNNSKLLPWKSGRNSKISPKNITTGAVRRSHRTQLSRDVTSTGSEGKKEVMESDVKNEQNDVNTKHKKGSQRMPRSQGYLSQRKCNDNKRKTDYFSDFDEEARFKINPKLLALQYSKKGNKKPKKLLRRSIKMVSSSDSDEMELSRFTFPEFTIDTSRIKRRSAENNSPNSLIGSPTTTQQNYFNKLSYSNYPTKYKYYITNHRTVDNISKQTNNNVGSTGTTGVDPNQFEEQCDGADKIDEEYPEKNYRCNPNLVTCDINYDNFEESEEIPLQHFLFDAIIKEKKLSKCTTLSINHILENKNMLNGESNVELALPLMEQDIGLYNLDKNNFLSNIEENCTQASSVIIDVIGDNSPTKENVKKCKNDVSVMKFSRRVPVDHELRENFTADSLSPCIDQYLSSVSQNPVIEKLSIVLNNKPEKYCTDQPDSRDKTEKLISDEDNYLDPLQDLSFNSISLFESINSPTQNTTSSEIDVMLEVKELQKKVPQISSDDVENSNSKINQLKTELLNIGDGDQILITNTKTFVSEDFRESVDLEQWKNFMTEEESD